MMRPSIRAGKKEGKSDCGVYWKVNFALPESEGKSINCSLRRLGNQILTM